jgi:hypothetical protein
MAEKTVKFDANGMRQLSKGFLAPLKKSRAFFAVLGTVIDKQTQLQFRSLGGRAGVKWNKLSPNTIQMPSGTFRIRYGTDLSGRPKGTYKPGKKRKMRRYSFVSRALQASGGFRKSFNIIRVTSNSLHYGTRHKLAKQILSKGRRVLYVTNKDERVFSTMWGAFWFKELFK